MVVRMFLFKQIDYVMVTVSDMNRSLKFYRDKLGIPVKFESPQWSEFQTGATVLALHGGGKIGAKAHEATAGTASIGFYVDNLDQKYNELKTNGVVFLMPPADRGEEKIKLAVCQDPDGLAISIAEHMK